MGLAAKQQGVSLPCRTEHLLRVMEDDIPGFSINTKRLRD